MQGRTTPGRTALLYQSQWNQKFGAAENQNPDICQHTGTAGHIAGYVAVGCAGGGAVYRSVHQLHRALNSDAGNGSMFKMTPNVLRNLFFPKATRRYPREVRPPFENARGALLN